MKTKYKSLAELKKGSIKDGKINESKLTIVLDNGCTHYYYEDGKDDEADIELTVESAGNGYLDYYELYKLCFPLATVEKC